MLKVNISYNSALYMETYILEKFQHMCTKTYIGTLLVTEEPGLMQVSSTREQKDNFYATLSQICRNAVSVSYATMMLHIKYLKTLTQNKHLYFTHVTLLLLRFDKTWLHVILWLDCFPCFFCGCPGNTPHDENRSTNHPLSGPPELEKPQEHVHASPIKHWWKTVLMAITSRQHFQPAAQGRKTVLAAGSQLACMEVFRARGAAGDTDWDYQGTCLWQFVSSFDLCSYNR